MNKKIAILHLVIVSFFICLLGYTAFATQHLRGLAADFAIRKTDQHAEKIITVGTAVIDAVDERGWISAAQQKLAERELNEFRKDPHRFLKDVTESRGRNLPGIGKLAELVSIKRELRTYFDSIVSSLLADVRIFAGTNLVAGLLGLAFCVCYGRTRNSSLLLFSISLCVAVLYGCWMFVDSLSFFSILFQCHLGWYYPCFVIAACIWMFSQANSPSGPSSKSDSPRSKTT